MKKVVCMLALVAGGVAAAVPPAEIDAAIARGVKYLLAQQAADGSFSDPQMPALTALPLWALVRGGEGQRFPGIPGDGDRFAGLGGLLTEDGGRAFFQGCGDIAVAVCRGALHGDK